LNGGMNVLCDDEANCHAVYWPTLNRNLFATVLNDRHNTAYFRSYTRQYNCVAQSCWSFSEHEPMEMGYYRSFGLFASALNIRNDWKCNKKGFIHISELVDTKWFTRRQYLLKESRKFRNETFINNRNFAQIFKCSLYHPTLE
jgi:hypothetical protein